MRVKAILTTKYEDRGYRPRPVDRVESFNVDSAMDTDSDAWAIEIGDPDLELIETLRRDNEVRVNLYGVARAVENLHSGFADDISLTQAGTLVINGRDVTAPAVDSMAPPQQWKWARPQDIVAKDARVLKIGDRLQLDKAPAIKRFYTDGSESYWEKWYRFYRKRASWIWAEPDGLIRAGKLNYGSRPLYKFGSPSGMTSSVARQGWIPVEAVEIRKTTTTRVGELWVIGHRGTIPFISKANDTTTRDWIKRPRKIVEDTHSRTQGEAVRTAWEEIHESKVGALEISLTIFNPGFIIRQNQIALVNIPKVGLTDEFFIVGVKVVGIMGSGVWQEIRLRQKQYAISTRVPDDPKLAEEPRDKTATSMGALLGVRDGWGDYFVKAAQKYHGVWDFNLFLACLLAMCDHESSFTNVREGGHTEWYEKPTTDWAAKIISGLEQTNAAARLQQELDKWHKLFANKAGNPLNPFSREAGVGPMQLTDSGFKDWADEFAGKKGEYDGGRWIPEWNIMAGARAFAGKLKGIPATNQNNIFLGVKAYNGAGPRAEKYMREIMAAVKSTYLPQVESIRDTAVKQSAISDGIDLSGQPLRKVVLSDPNISYTRASQKTDISSGQIADEVLRGILAFSQAGFQPTITALKTDHDTLTTEGRVSAHSTGHAVDIGAIAGHKINKASSWIPMKWLLDNIQVLEFKQLIGPTRYLCYNKGVKGAKGYDEKTLSEHEDHIHIGW